MPFPEFDPDKKKILFFSRGRSATPPDGQSSGDRLSAGAFSGSTRVVHSLIDGHNLTPTNVVTGLFDDAVYLVVAGNATVEEKMGLQSLDPDGFTLSVQNVSGASEFVWYIAFGD